MGGLGAGTVVAAAVTGAVAVTPTVAAAVAMAADAPLEATGEGPGEAQPAPQSARSASAARARLNRAGPSRRDGLRATSMAPAAASAHPPRPRSREVAMARFFVALIACTLWLSGARPARADADRLGIVLEAVVSGQDLPAIVITPQEGLKQLTIKLTRNDGEKQELRAADVGAGSRRELRIQQPFGRFSYEGHFKVKWATSEPSDFRMQFVMTRVDKLRLELRPEDVDLDARTLSFKINNPAAKAELTIVGKDGKAIATHTKDYAAAAPNTALALSWPDPGADVLYMDLKVHDVAGFWKAVRLTPFVIEIPHDDVEFEFGKWDIRKSEEPKLEATMKHIRDALDKHGTLLQLKLYVAGYTDTVGSKQSNITLSYNRARAIATWFRKKGLKIPIFYQGFGEEVLAKRTPDETPEPANRRAIYILSSQLPRVSDTIPKQDWKPVE
jgi:outer membrane protein OmpA-like peptidoglycan-associated protein